MAAILVALADADAKMCYSVMPTLDSVADIDVSGHSAMGPSKWGTVMLDDLPFEIPTGATGLTDLMKPLAAT